MKQHLLYPDICKFVAIFLVTWSHSAQCISGRMWTNLWGGAQIDIAFNMPLFMLISGWFINLEKMRNTSFSNYFLKKFKRLIIPSAVWYFIHTVIANKIPEPSISNCYWYFYAMLNYYWYLTALFLCLILIWIFAKLFYNDILCIVLSLTFVFICPISHIANVNFMFPFIWAGYGLNKVLSSKYTYHFTTMCFFIGGGLCIFWNPYFSVYISPLTISYVTWHMIIIYIYRFLLGFCISSFIIYLIKRNEMKLCRFAIYGQYSLAIYTISIILLNVISTILNKTQIHTNQFVILDLLSFCLCIAIVFFSIIFSNYCRRHHYLKLLFLGE